MTTLLGTGAFALIGMRMWIGAKERMTRIKAEVEGHSHSETIEALQSQVEALSDDVSELHERLDFAERLLTHGRHPASAETGGEDR
jgi:hypothetical protein